MNNTEMYFLKINLAIAVFYLVYRFVFYRDTFWAARRFYLVFGILLSVLYPFISLAGWLENQEPIQVLMANYVNLKDITVTAEPASILTFRNLLYVIYMLVAGFFCIKMCMQLGSIFSWKLKGTKSLLQGTEVVAVNEIITPFSFFNLIFINPDLHNELETKQILTHEQTHARQLHSMDVLLSEILTIICWFNPAVWLLKREIRQNLEFLADNNVLQSGFDSKNYQYHLLQLSYQTPEIKLTNKFNVSPIKKRIIMMNQQKTSKAGILKYSLIVPLALALVLSSNAQSVVSSAKKATTTTKVKVKTAIQSSDKDMVYTIVEKMPQFPGGETALFNYINQNVKYPAEAIKKNEQGSVIIRFIVNSLGKVEKVEILRGVSESIDKEALRVINTLPDFIPGEQNGKKVAVWYTMPITFRLDGDSKIKDNKRQTTTKIAESFEIVDGSKPLYLIDEKPATEAEVKALNPQDIKEVKVLKDATATALYGSRAVNGVVLITMKK